MLSTYIKAMCLLFFYVLLDSSSFAQKPKTIQLDSSKKCFIKLSNGNESKTDSKVNSEFKFYYIEKPRTFFSVNTSKNVVVDVKDSKNGEMIFINLVKVDSLTIIGNESTQIFINNATNSSNKIKSEANFIKVDKCVIEALDLPQAVLNSMEINNSIIKYLNIKNGSINKSFIIYNSDLDSSNFNNAYLPEKMYLSKLDLARNGSINFTNLIHLENNKRHPSLELERTINLREVDLDRIILPYDRFSFHVDSSQSYQHRIWIYQKLIKGLNKEGLIAQHQKYTADYTELLDQINRRPITNWISKMWWSKGRDKGRVIFWGVGCFIVFFVFNFALIKVLPLVYYPVNFKGYFKEKSLRYQLGCSGNVFNIFNWRFSSGFCLTWYYIWGVFWYTVFIFLGLRLNLEVLKFRSLWLVSYIIVQYTLGLIFVAYIVSFVIIRL